MTLVAFEFAFGLPVIDVRHDEKHAAKGEAHAKGVERIGKDIEHGDKAQ
jgi:hypothetical protein